MSQILSSGIRSLTFLFFHGKQVKFSVPVQDGGRVVDRVLWEVRIPAGRRGCLPASVVVKTFFSSILGALVMHIASEFITCIITLSFY